MAFEDIVWLFITITRQHFSSPVHNKSNYKSIINHNFLYFYSILDSKLESNFIKNIVWLFEPFLIHLFTFRNLFYYFSYCKVLWRICICIHVLRDFTHLQLAENNAWIFKTFLTFLFLRSETTNAFKVHWKRNFCWQHFTSC